MRMWTCRFFLVLLILGPASGLWAVDFSVPPNAEIATGPEGLLQLEQQDKVTVRAMRAWGRLPDESMKLGQDMRKDTTLDLLNADLAQLRTWGAMAGEGDPALVPYQDRLNALADYMAQGRHLDWSPQQTGVEVPVGALLRSGGKRWTQTVDGPVLVPDLLPTGPVAGDVPVAGETSGQETSPAPVTASSNRPEKADLPLLLSELKTMENDPGSRVSLALAARTNVDGDADPVRSVALLEQAAAAGDADAMALLADEYDAGLWVVRDEAKAAQLRRQAAEAGSQLAIWGQK